MSTGSVFVAAAAAFAADKAGVADEIGDVLLAGGESAVRAIKEAVEPVSKALEFFDEPSLGEKAGIHKKEGE